MIFTNGLVFTDGKFQRVDVKTENDRIVTVSEKISVGESDEVINLNGNWLLPGFIDVHTHGRDGVDFSDSTAEEMVRVRRSYAQCGVTSILATTMTMEQAYAKASMKRLRQAIEQEAPGARILGINLEGPFLGPDKKGCHDPECLQKISVRNLEELDACAGGHIRLVDVDPTLEGAMELIRSHSKEKKFSIAHTSASYETANQAVDAGAGHVTHLFNAMNGLHHREPGIVGMVCDRKVWAELICDGIHVHPSVIRMIYRCAGEKLCIVSDSLSAAGLGDGVYQLGGMEVHVKGKRAALSDGTLACSVSNVFEECRNVISFGVAPETAILSATENPARAMGLEQEIGAIKEGLRADLLVVSPEFELLDVYAGGISLKQM